MSSHFCNLKTSSTKYFFLLDVLFLFSFRSLCLKKFASWNSGFLTYVTSYCIIRLLAANLREECLVYARNDYSSTTHKTLRGKSFRFTNNFE